MSGSGNGRVGAVWAAAGAGCGLDTAEGFDGCWRVVTLMIDRGAVPLNPHLITRKQLRIVGSWGFAEKHYLGHIEALSRLSARFDLTRLNSSYRLEDADSALDDMSSGRVMKAVLDMSRTS